MSASISGPSASPAAVRSTRPSPGSAPAIAASARAASAARRSGSRRLRARLRPGAPGVSIAVRRFSRSRAPTGAALPGSAHPDTCTTSGRPGAGGFGGAQEAGDAAAEVDDHPAGALHRPAGQGAVDGLGARGGVGGVGVDQEVLQAAVDDERGGVAAGGQRLDQDLPAPHGRDGVMPAAASRPRVSVSGRPTTFE